MVNQGDDVEIIYNKKASTVFGQSFFNWRNCHFKKLVKVSLKWRKRIHQIDCQMHGAHVGGQLIVQ